ncbi:probable glycerol-3-phosphate acyltransferase 3 [Amaranthus tricolor]|uniref:probable glycerol-3-phosphate acyltransferase 3 n=1 Tax=Amaranthus tricolor TaxID=29722 RepID=UPI0025835EC2|nr:probable glycerol-3-phosphate acyltransferase 3 [Amaranthus tricolor]
MATYISLLRVVIIFVIRIIFHEHSKTSRYLQRKLSNVFNSSPSQTKHQKYPSFLGLDEQISKDDYTLIFNMEETLLKSSSMFPYFMLAFEGGSLLRAFLLLIMYPFISLFNKEMGLKIMVMISFFGVKKDGFRVGKCVLPKFFLEDVGLEGFEMVRKCKRKLGLSELPHVMVESFLRDYLEVEYVFGKEIKVFKGYYLGLMEDNISKNKMEVNDLKNILGKDNGVDIMGSNVFGICGNKSFLSHSLFSFCKLIYLTSEEMRSKWQSLPSKNYPKPLIFHDGRLALRPTPISTLALFLWVPFGILLAIFRILIALCLPINISTPILIFSGLRLLTSTKNPKVSSTLDLKTSSKGKLYACNHRTLLDPLYLSFALKKPLTAVTYSLSKVSEILAPIKTFRLTRNRDQDAIMMKKLLNQGNLVVCPEGTTCREPYLLRFSPLFSEMNKYIVPVAMDCHVTMFYGTTASGLKCLDPIFFLMNPRPSYTVQLLQEVPGLSTCQDSSQLRFDVANHVQNEIGQALNFKCTNLTREDKYLILAGNNGVV